MMIEMFKVGMDEEGSTGPSRDRGRLCSHRDGCVGERVVVRRLDVGCALAGKGH